VPRPTPRADAADSAHYADDSRRKRHEALLQAMRGREAYYANMETAHPKAKSPPPPSADDPLRRSLQSGNTPREPPPPPGPPQPPESPGAPPPPPPVDWDFERGALVALYEAAGGAGCDAPAGAELTNTRGDRYAA
jgi:hypothetical protein